MRRVCLAAVLLAGVLLMLTAASGEGGYSDALAAWTDHPLGTEEIAVPLEGYEAEDVGLTWETLEGEKALCWRTGLGRVTFHVRVPGEGLYCLWVRYAQLDDSSGQIERGVRVNGVLPYAEAEAFLFPKQFEDTEYPFRRNEYGNEIRPRQRGVTAPRELTLSGRGGMHAEPLLFAFKAGENTLTLTGVKGSIALFGIALRAPEEVPPYETYLAAHPGTPAGGTVILEAEKIHSRSSKSIRNLTSSNPGVSPSEAGHKLLNVLGGSSWNLAHDYVEWVVEAPEDGLYCLGFRYTQNFNMALTSFREIRVDGKVPFREFEAVGFPFRSDWGTLIPGGDAPYRVFLTKGEHILRLTATNAPYAEVWKRLDGAVSAMKALDLYVTEIIGSDSDVYRIWKLEKYIPSIKADLGGMVEDLEAVREGLGRVIGSSGSLGTLDAAILDLKKLYADHNQIARRDDALSSVYTTLSNWEDSMVSQPLALDRIFLAGEKDRIPEGGLGFFEGLGYNFSHFVSSFFSREETALGGGDEAVTVWVQRNRDYVDMMQLLADEYFTPETGIRVNVSYCPPGTQLLVLSNAAGQQPDVVTGVDLTLPFEFGIRNALVDLSALEGFEELVAPLPKGSRIPNYFSGAEYGIPEEIRVKVLFYRTDILESLGVQVPETWPEAMGVLSTLLQQNYAFYYPYGDYLTFFFQNGVDVYTPDGRALAFTNEKGYAAYRQWTELYVKYGLQPQMSSFYQHFRIGDVPMGIADIDQYIQFDMAAPDISGDWTIAQVPGTRAEDGSLVRWQAGSQTSAVMFRTTEQRQARAWAFLRWWLDTETQCLFAEEMENNYGEAFRWFSANLEVVERQNWPESHKAVLLDQMRWYKQLPMVPGGSYMTSRELWNAWTRIVVDKGNYREEIETAVEDIRLEIAIKQREMGYIDQEGNALIPMSLMTVDHPGEKGE